MATLTRSTLAATSKATKAKKGVDQRLKQAQRAAMLLKHASDPTRIQLILMLAAGELHVGAIAGNGAASMKRGP